MDRPDVISRSSPVTPGRSFSRYGVLLVFLVLAAQYESLLLPIAILMIVPMAILSALAGVWLMGADNNIFTQIGLIVLVGLASKNAILIVEFARELEAHGRSVIDAAIEASRLRPATDPDDVDCLHRGCHSAHRFERSGRGDAFMLWGSRCSSACSALPPSAW